MNANLEETVLTTAKTMTRPTISELVKDLTQTKGLKHADVVKAVYTAWKKGTLNLTEAQPTTKLPQYFFSLENAWFWGVTGLLACTIAIIFAVNIPTLIYLRYVLGAVFVLVLPGFMLILALYPRSGELDTLERAAFSVGLSLALVPLVSLLLNYTPWGIKLEPIVGALSILVEALAVVVVLRRFRYHKLGLRQ